LIADIQSNGLIAKRHLQDNLFCRPHLAQSLGFDGSEPRLYLLILTRFLHANR